MNHPARLPRPQRRGLGLIRVSQERDGTTSPEVQRYAIQQYADAKGITITDWVEGIDESGSRAKSPWWLKLDAAAQAIVDGTADVIVVWKFSRTARHRLKWAILLDRVDTAGGSVESATEQTDATPSGRFARGMLGELNAYQAELIGETWREAHDRRRRAGLPASGGPRFGYEQQDDGTYAIDPVSGPVLADMYRRFLRGAGLTAIARHLNATGSPTRTGKPWTRTTVTQVLDSGFGAGLIYTGNTSGVERTYLDGAHEPVIPPDEWDAYVARRKTASPATRSTRGGYLLTGLVTCGDCGSRMHGAPVDRKPHYICSRAHELGDVRKICMRADLAERAVFEWLLQLAPDLEARAAAIAEQQKSRTATTAEARVVSGRLDKVERRLQNLTERLLDGTVTPETYRPMAEKLEQEREGYHRWLAQAVPNPAETASLATLPPDLERLWPGMTMEQRTLVVRPLVGRVAINRPPRPGVGVWRERVAVTPSWGSTGG